MEGRPVSRQNVRPAEPKSPHERERDERIAERLRVADRRAAMVCGICGQKGHSTLDCTVGRAFA